MSDLDRVAEVIEDVFTSAVENCEFDQIVGVEDTTVDVPERSMQAAIALDELGLLN